MHSAVENMKYGMVKISRTVFLSFAIAFSMVAVTLSAKVLKDHVDSGGIPCWDLRLRYDEIQCVQGGLNPYEIFVGKVTSPKYRGHPRPDVPFDTDESKKLVCTYPAWHTSWCYFYGWLPWPFMRLACIIINTIFLFAVWCYVLSRFSKRTVLEKAFVSFAFFGFFANPITVGYLSGNYGFLLMALALAMFWLLERDYDILAGLCWGVMMFKPQVGLLFGWPILLKGKTKTIATAATFCIIGLLIGSLLIGKDPIGLLMEIPDSVPPDPAGELIPGTFTWFCQSLLGVSAKTIKLVLCFSLCGVLSFVLRRSKSWIVSALPVIYMIPLWTYSKPYDLVIQWPWLLIVFAYIMQDFDGMNSVKPAIKESLRILASVMLLASIIVNIDKLLAAANMEIWAMGTLHTIYMKHIGATCSIVSKALFILFCFYAWKRKDGAVYSF